MVINYRITHFGVISMIFSVSYRYCSDAFFVRSDIFSTQKYMDEIKDRRVERVVRRVVILNETQEEK
jgi:hypothetical protein